MKKNKKKFIFFFFIFVLFFQNGKANDEVTILSLKNNKVNLRQGPSFEYPIKLIYKKKYLPLIIVDKSDSWRKTKDLENNSGWIHISQLSKKKSAININNNSVIYKKPTIYSKPIVKLELGRLVLIDRCKIKWCKIKSGGYAGWILKSSLWGKI